MQTCTPVAFCFWSVFSQIGWLWYIISVVAVFALGAVWYSALFPKTWARVFHVDTSRKSLAGVVYYTMLTQLVVTALLGIVLFAVTLMSVWAAVAVSVGFCGWLKGSLLFQMGGVNKDYCQAALINAGFLAIACAVFIFCATL